MIAPTVRIDSTGLNRGIVKASKYSKRTLPQIVNTSAYWIARNAQKAMPFVTAQKVDTELGTIVTPKIGKSGKVLSTKSARNRTYSSALATLIVLARTNKGSHYNALTKGRYALPSLRGMSASGFQATLAALVHKMIAARHRSGHFLRAGWIPAIKKLMSKNVARFNRGGTWVDDNSGGGFRQLGDATIAQEGVKCQATIENQVGMTGIQAESFNRAMLLHGTGPLQKAMDVEGVKQMEYALRKYNEELAETVRKFWG